MATLDRSRDTARRPRFQVPDDSVTRRGDGHPEHSGKSVGHRAEDLARRAGAGNADREEHGVKGADRPHAARTPRDRTGINPLDVIDSRSPYL